MEFLNLVNAVASQLNAQKIESVCEMLEKLIVLGDQLESHAQNALSEVVAAVEKPAPVAQQAQQ